MAELKNEAHAAQIDILQQTYLVKRGFVLYLMSAI